MDCCRPCCRSVDEEDNKDENPFNMKQPLLKFLVEQCGQSENARHLLMTKCAIS